MDKKPQQGKTFQRALDPIQKTLLKLEKGGLLMSSKVGNTRIFQWNPRYPFLVEIQALMTKTDFGKICGLAHSAVSK